MLESFLKKNAYWILSYSLIYFLDFTFHRLVSPARARSLVDRDFHPHVGDVYG